jgi:hypothetical protein
VATTNIDIFCITSTFAQHVDQLNVLNKVLFVFAVFMLLVYIA